MQAVEGERAAAKEAAQLLLKAGDENIDEEAAKDQEHKHVEESRMVMQAMHVPHDLGRLQPKSVIQRACDTGCSSHVNKRASCKESTPSMAWMPTEGLVFLPAL